MIFAILEAGPVILDTFRVEVAPAAKCDQTDLDAWASVDASTDVPTKGETPSRCFCRLKDLPRETTRYGKPRPDFSGWRSPRCSRRKLAQLSRDPRARTWDPLTKRPMICKLQRPFRQTSGWTLVEPAIEFPLSEWHERLLERFRRAKQNTLRDGGRGRLHREYYFPAECFPLKGKHSRIEPGLLLQQPPVVRR